MSENVKPESLGEADAFKAWCRQSLPDNPDCNTYSFEMVRSAFGAGGAWRDYESRLSAPAATGIREAAEACAAWVDSLDGFGSVPLGATPEAFLKAIADAIERILLSRLGASGKAGNCPECERLRRERDDAILERYEALGVKTTEGLTASEWVLRTGKAEKERDAALAERDEARKALENEHAACERAIRERDGWERQATDERRARCDLEDKLNAALATAQARDEEAARLSAELLALRKACWPIIESCRVQGGDRELFYLSREHLAGLVQHKESISAALGSPR